PALLPHSVSARERGPARGGYPCLVAALSVERSSMGIPAGRSSTDLDGATSASAGFSLPLMRRAAGSTPWYRDGRLTSSVVLTPWSWRHAAQNWTRCFGGRRPSRHVISLPSSRACS